MKHYVHLKSQNGGDFIIYFPNDGRWEWCLYRAPGKEWGKRLLEVSSRVKYDEILTPIEDQITTTEEIDIYKEWFHKFL